MPSEQPQRLSASTYRIDFDPATATLESAMAVLKELLGRAGCPACGRLSLIDVHIDPRIHLPKEIAGVRAVSEVVRNVDVGMVDPGMVDVPR